MELVFLGTGGGRWMTITQKLYTGGIRLHGRQRVHLDPGAGAVARANGWKIDPIKTDGILVSHCHPDHYTDAEVFIEAMTKGMTKTAGVVGASKSVILGNEKLGPAISKYHRGKVSQEHVVKPGDTFKIEDMGVEALPTRHSDPEGVGFKLFTEKGIITYTGDTEYYEGLADSYHDSNLLILNVIRPRGERLKWHMCSDDVIEILEETRPRAAIITHFGWKMLPVSRKEAARIEDKTGVKTTAASDGMRYHMDG